MNTKHTPGPWEISRDAVPAGHVQTTVYQESSGDRVATAFLAEANAQLIAASPDLLAACEAAMLLYDLPKIGPGCLAWLLDGSRTWAMCNRKVNCE